MYREIERLYYVNDGFHADNDKYNNIYYGKLTNNSDHRHISEWT